jgi:hypothetical protein
VPDRAAVVGEGEMLFDASGLPPAWRRRDAPSFGAPSDLEGDVLSLGNGSSLRGLVIEDAEGRSTGNPSQSSRARRRLRRRAHRRLRDRQSQSSGVAPAGPTGERSSSSRAIRTSPSIRRSTSARR